MPQHKSAVKRLRTSKKQNAANRINRSTIRTLTKKVRESTDPAEGKSSLQLLLSRLDKAAKNGLLHPNQVARRKSRAQRFINGLSTE